MLDFDPTTSSPHPDIAYGTLSYDSGNRLTQIDYTHSGSTLDDLSWTYDAANRVTGVTSSVDGSASYSYNTTNEATAATYTGTHQPANESNSFDANGNRTNTGYTTGTNNQLTSDGTFNYTYDHEGNRVSRTRISSATANDYLTTYTWDYRNRLTDVDYYNNSSVLTKHIHYVYDVFDHLIGTEIDATGSGSYSSSEWYALDITADPNAPAQPVLQFDGSGNETHRFLKGPSAAGVDAVMAQEGITTQGSAGTTDYMLADDLASVRDVVNTSSAVVDHIVYSSFGQVAYESNSAIAHWAGFAGYKADANTGLDYADHRWYDPSVGRWISEDPLGFGGGDTNLSRYVRNDATNATDPMGLFGVDLGGGLAGMGGAGQGGGFLDGIQNALAGAAGSVVGTVVGFTTGNPAAGDAAGAAVGAALGAGPQGGAGQGGGGGGNIDAGDGVVLGAAAGAAGAGGGPGGGGFPFDPSKMTADELIEKAQEIQDAINDTVEAIDAATEEEMEDPAGNLGETLKYWEDAMKFLFDIE
ncbi:MAG TPA: RHS repeat-associated core domain-containing protein [Pirellulales bacterium]|nr:RHS repeat-associated core domain-containing protein [Pirellulales bacterium]